MAKKYKTDIFVQEKSVDDGSYLDAHRKIEDCDDGEVAVYTLQKVVVKSTKVIVADKK